MGRIKDILSPLRFHEEEKDRLARILFVFAAAAFLGLAVLLLVRRLSGSSVIMFPIAAAAALMLVSMALLRAKLLGLAANLILWTLLVMVDYLIWRMNGILDSAVLAIPGILIIAGMVLNRIHFIAFTTACLFSVGVTGYLQLNGFLRSEFVIHTTTIDVADITVMLLVTAILIRVFADDLLKGLARARASEERYRRLVESSTDAIMLVDESGAIAFASPRSRDFLGAGENEPLIGKPVADWVAPESLPGIMADIGDVSRGRNESRIRTLEMRKNDGTRFWAESRISATEDPRERSGRFLLAFREISERKRWEEALQRRCAEEELIASVSQRFIGYAGREIDDEIRQGLADLCLFTKADRGAVFLMDENGSSFNMAFEWRVEGTPSGAVIYSNITPDAYKWTFEKIRRDNVLVINSPSEYPEEAVFEREASVKLGIQATLVVLFRDRDGSLIGGLNVSQIKNQRTWTEDEARLLTVIGSIFANAIKKRQADEEMLKSLREKELLLHEVHHRVKNNMQVISSLINIEAEKANDPALRNVFDGTVRRISSMALVHEKLYDSSDVESIDFKEYLESMTEELALSLARGGIRCRVEAEGIRLGIDKAIPCGLLVNELVSNAFKHAFPEKNEGLVSVRLRRAEDGSIRLTVSDDGIGLPAGLRPENSSSMGMTLVSALTSQLRGAIAVETNRGTVFSLSFPESPRKA